MQHDHPVVDHGSSDVVEVGDESMEVLGMSQDPARKESSSKLEAHFESDHDARNTMGEQ